MALEEFNSRVRGWARDQVRDMKSKAGQLGIEKYSGDLHRMLRARTRKRHGEINKVSFVFPRHAIFVNQGVGRGYPIESVGGNRNKLRKPKPFLSNTLDANVSKLADITMDHLGDLTLKSIKF